MVPHGPEQQPTGDPVGDGTPVADVVESILGCKWTLRLLSLIANGCHRPSAMLRACPGLSAKVLNERLRKLTRFGIVSRRVYGEKPPVKVEYRLTPFGERVGRIVEEIGRLQQEIDRGAIGRDAATQTTNDSSPPR